MPSPDTALPTVSSSDFLARSESVLRSVFGFDTFRAGQQQALEAIAGGRDCLVIMPTGSGKSLCYQVPAHILDGATLVVSPLIALMKDQVDGLRLKGVPATFINSSLTIEEQSQRLEGLCSGEHRLVYVAPERFRSRAFRRALDRARIALLAVDEAHCISEWGHDFRPDYRRLAEVRRQLGEVPAVALTATATPDVQDDIVRELRMESPERVVTGFDRPNLSYDVRRAVGDDRKLAELQRIVTDAVRGAEEDAPPSGIVYVGTRRHAEEVAGWLAELGSNLLPDARDPFCRAYHGGLEDDERRRVQEDFMEGRLPWVAATNAFGMGVDKADIRYVIHYDFPGSVESYYQEVGRAGRDGADASCILLFSEKDRRLREFFIDAAHPPRALIEAVHAGLWQSGENPVFLSAAGLLARLESSGGLPSRSSVMAVRSALVILERAGAIERLHHDENLAEIAPVAGREDHTEGREPHARRAPVKGPLWEAICRVFEQTDGEAAGVRLESWSRDLEIPIDALRRGLASLEAEGRIRYTPPFRGRAIRLPERRSPLEIDYASLQRRREHEEKRLETMIAFAIGRGCRRDSILSYFGEPVPDDPCGRCDECADRSPRDPDGEARELDDEEFTVIRKVLSGVARARGSCGRQRVTQMLLGSRARAMAERGLDGLSTYGILRGARRTALRRLFDQLELAGCVRQDPGRYPILRLTRRGLRVMKDEERVEIAFPTDLWKGPAGGASRCEPEGFGDGDEVDERLFHRLRALRREIADELGVPAYRVFPDRTLRAMAQVQPTTGEDLLSLPGVGVRTLERFGDAFLAAIREG